ncbi:hypothetical protein P4V33_09370 [Brevibacillus borstelensis]|uniref:hypothetical protein n=1 Tax=Brevibacillus borstelensis TaxID=45462 RepID=UPI002E1F37B8|nr:hypothetical protein [Brevibacillus borstelensis]
MQRNYDKEKVYDERISPLMAQILNICRAEGIPMVATFYIQSADVNADGARLYCTSRICPPDNTPPHFYAISECAVSGGERPMVAAFAVMTGAPGNVH